MPVLSDLCQISGTGSTLTDPALGGLAIDSFGLLFEAMAFHTPGKTFCVSRLGFAFLGELLPRVKRSDDGDLLVGANLAALREPLAENILLLEIFLGRVGNDSWRL